MDAYQITLPVRVRFGAGSLAAIGDEANQLAVKHALVVTDPGVYGAGLTDPVKEHLSGAGLSVEVFSEAEPEPTLTRLDAMARELRNHRFDLLVGVGGGSSIDMAKGLSALLAHGRTGRDYLGIDNVPGPGIPVFALPTTAGTGSEVTGIAIFGEPEKELKQGMVSPYLLPRVALVDPALTYGCPQKVSASSGIDALVHAIESYTGSKANRFSDALALEAMRLIVGNLKTVVGNPSDKEARRHMAEGALLAGMAFANSGVGAVHALAYPLGGRFHVPHGVANGLMLAHVMKYNLSANISKYVVVAKMLGVETQGLSREEAAEKGVEAAKILAADIGIPIRLRDLEIPEEALEGMAVSTMEVTRLLSNNPRRLTLDDVRRIWQDAW